MLTRALFAIVLLACSSLVADEPQTGALFDFSDLKASQQWRAVNDGVMGGRSDGRFRVTEEGTMEFFGTLSLANNGGFASVRSRSRKLSFKKSDTVVTRIKGDGRRYTLNLYVPVRRIAFSYRVEFETTKDEWMEVRVPLKRFQATSFGRIVKTAGPVNPEQVISIGFLLADKQAGPFRLEVDWIKSEASAVN